MKTEKRRNLLLYGTGFDPLCKASYPLSAWHSRLQGGRGLSRQDPVRVGGTESFQARIAGPQTLQDLGNTVPGIQPFRSRWRDGALAALRLWRRLLRGSGIPFFQLQRKLLQLHVDAVHGQHGQDRAKKLGAGSHRSTPVREQE
ncbi:hypothetical protein CYB_2049 [Synechococcus sp. JA-2-3B'a(2-13)]|nr:hypothetical protein CYB_2049 [Synechococcus sp. JA-2-3B'a(2-13)]